MIGSDAVEALAFFTATASVAWSAAFAWAKWLQHRHDAPPASAPVLGGESQRLAQIEAMLETLAVEVERLGEAQRYTVRLLEERSRLDGGAAQTRLGEGGRVNTPH
ncbi:MAG TPA: hypothetical protein VJU87_08750 [Gemmatimonadaceae bacterium]|nr:hypothetical protein [Gemmatimonadaceae bacterium]